MANTTFTARVTKILAAWLNDVNDAVYEILGDGTSIPTTADQARTNLGAAARGANSDITSLTGLTTPLAITQGGTSGATQTAAFDALSPLTTQGDVLYHNGTDNVRLAPATAGWALVTGGAGANPSWASVSGVGSAIVNNTATVASPLALTRATHHQHILRTTDTSTERVFTFPSAVTESGMYLWIDNATANGGSPGVSGLRLLSDGGLIGGAAAAGTTNYAPAYSITGYQSDGTNWVVFNRTPSFWEFNANGTWYCPPGVYEIEVDGSGGGGGGTSGTGGGSGKPGNGGSSGAVCKKQKLVVVPGTAYTVTIGAGGATNANGSSTSLGAVLTLAGGNTNGAQPAGGVAGGATAIVGTSAQQLPGQTGGLGAIGVNNAVGQSAQANTGGGGAGGSGGIDGTGYAGGVGASGYLRVRA